MKIKLSELKQAVTWIETNTNQEYIFINVDGGNQLDIKTFDRGESEVVITLFQDGNLLPKIKRTEILR